MDAKQVKINSYCQAKRGLIHALFFFLALFVASRHCTGQPSELTSSNGLYTVRIVNRALPHADRLTGDCTLRVLKREHAISEVPTTGYLINALWSPDGRYVAVNNRRGNSGDYVWVFSLKDGKVLKRPDDKSVSYPPRKIARICEECNEASFDKDLIISKAWKSGNELEVETRWRFYKTALILRRAVYRISGRKMVLVDEQISRHPVDWQPPEE